MSEEECRKRDETEHIGRYIGHLSKIIRCAANANLAKNGVDITGAQLRLLGYIRCCNEHGKCVYQRDIESEFQIKRSSVASILANLERGGYIVRTVDDSDARTKKVMLTEKGISTDRAMMENLSKLENTISADMTEEEREMFISLIKRAIKNVENLGVTGQ